ncbi:hypothetical protein CASFOL_029000 [Castilleja foliolosa]|uniref:Uncharacterized protein n=1 Tax=Castilleja foliolosa TaxID=1961234 RepID=A0ABD3CDN3_9LAMI
MNGTEDLEPFCALTLFSLLNHELDTAKRQNLRRRSKSKPSKKKRARIAKKRLLGLLDGHKDGRTNLVALCEEGFATVHILAFAALMAVATALGMLMRMMIMYVLLNQISRQELPRFSVMMIENEEPFASLFRGLLEREEAYTAQSVRLFIVLLYL